MPANDPTPRLRPNTDRATPSHSSPLAGGDEPPAPNSLHASGAGGLTTHTPGPWTVRQSDPSEGYNCWWVHAADGRSIASADGYQSDPERQANARLIAAAPDLLQALEACVKVLNQFHPSPDDVEDAMTLAPAAIMKARGGDAE